MHIQIYTCKQLQCFKSDARYCLSDDVEIFNAIHVGARIFIMIMNIQPLINIEA